MSKFIKKSMIIFISLLFLILAMASVQAEDINETSVLTDVDSVDAVSSDVDSSDIVSDDGCSTDENEVKTFTDLYDEIYNANESSVLILNNSYKYDDAYDQSHKTGVTIDKSLTIIGKNDCYIDGSGLASLIFINEHHNITFENITFKNGNYNKAAAPGGYGGAGICLLYYSNLTIRNCVFENNIIYNANGGAISCQDHTITEIYNSTFRNNKAILSGVSGKYGMASAIQVGLSSTLKMYDTDVIGNDADLASVLVLSYRDDEDRTETSYAYIENCLFENNTANKYSGFYLDEYGRAELINTTFRNNTAEIGGALILDSSKYALVKNCLFERNSGTSGGAIRLAHDFTGSNVDIMDSKFIGNTAKYGGAIYSDCAVLKVSNCTFTSNSASETGGAIREINSGKIEVTDSTFTGNSANIGGAIYASATNAKSSNCTFSNNKASKNYPDIYGTIKVQISTVSSYYGNVELKVKVTSGWESLIPQEVRVKLVKGSTVFYSPIVETDASGIANLKMPEKTSTGTYSVVLTRYEGNYTVNSLKVTVSAVPCTVSFKATTFPYSGVASVTGTVKNNKGGKLPSGTMLKVKLYTGKSYTTSKIKIAADGSFKIPTATLAVGKHTVEITSADGNIKFSKITSYIKVTKATAKIKAPKTAKKNSKITVKIRNKYNNKAIKKVAFKVTMKSGKKTKSVNAKTNDKGIIKLNLKKLPKGKCKISISTTNKSYDINKKVSVKIK